MVRNARLLVISLLLLAIAISPWAMPLVRPKLAWFNPYGVRAASPKIGVVLWPTAPFDKWGTCDRLQRLGYNTRLVPADAGLDTLRQYDVIYVAALWTSASEIEHHAADYIAYVAGGGGLLVEQPNLEGLAFSPAILPYPVTFYWLYDMQDLQSVIVNPEHCVTKGLADREAPFPTDMITTYDKHYTVLARGPHSGSPSLLVGQYKHGRVLIDASDASPKNSFPISDELLQRMISWVAGADNCDVAANAWGERRTFPASLVVLPLLLGLGCCLIFKRSYT